MKAHCLNKAELSLLIEIEPAGVPDDVDRSFQYLLDDWQNWSIEFVCLANSLSQVLERMLGQGLDAQPTLERVYSWNETTGLFTVEEFDEDFIAYMLRYVCQTDLSIEENLIKIRNRKSEHVYP